MKMYKIVFLVIFAYQIPFLAVANSEKSSSSKRACAAMVSDGADAKRVQAVIEAEAELM